MTTTKEYGWAASTTDGEWYDIGAGWATREEAEKEIIEQGGTLDNVEIYEAVTDNGWDSWTPIDN